MDLTVTTLLAATSTAMQSEARISFDVRRFWGLLRSFENIRQLCCTAQPMT